MIDNRRVIEEAKRYVESDLTLEEVAREFGACKRTLQLHFRKLSELDYNLYKKVVAKNEASLMAGRKYGGSIGKRGKTYSKKEVLAIAEMMIDSQLNYDEVAAISRIPRSTIWELLHSDYIDNETREKLDLVAEANKKNQSVSEMINGVSRK